jgi:RNA-binding protein YhbY
LQSEYVLELGKNGVTDGVIAEAKRQLEARKTLKVRVQKSLWAEFNVDEFLAKVGARLEKKIGRTLVIRRAKGQ